MDEYIVDERVGCVAVYLKSREDEANGCHADDKRNIFYAAGVRDSNGAWSVPRELIDQAHAVCKEANERLHKANSAPTDCEVSGQEGGLNVDISINGQLVPFVVTGDSLLCVPSHKNKTVNLCLKGAVSGMHFPFARIKLYDRDCFVDAESVFPDAEVLGEEIVRRWKAATNPRITLTLAEIRNLALAAGFDVGMGVYDNEEDLEQEMTILESVRILDEETGVTGEPCKAAWFTEIPDEGVMPI
jgi:hypothetical protein